MKSSATTASNDALGHKVGQKSFKDVKQEEHLIPRRVYSDLVQLRQLGAVEVLKNEEF